MAEKTEPTRKWGEGALSAYGRQGWAEARKLAPYADSPFAAPTDFGMPGMATQGEIAQARRDESLSVEEEPALVGPADRDDPNRDDRGIDWD
jgi:hypothetical protein